MSLLERYSSQSSAAPPSPATGQELTLDDWKRVLARAGQGEVTRLVCDAVGGEFVVAPSPVPGSVTFTPGEIRRICWVGVTAVAAIYRVKRTFGGATVQG